MDFLQNLDSSFISFAKKYYGLVARSALFVIYFGFGLLKLAGLSPANDLALGFATKMGFGFISYELYAALAFIECLIGIMILFPKLVRPTILLMITHMLVVSSPLALYPEATWVQPLVPNLEGQYIIKNVALVALALGLVAYTKPLIKSAR